MSATILSDIILISKDGPEVDSFQPEGCVKRWMTSGRKRPSTKLDWGTDIHDVYTDASSDCDSKCK